MEIDGKYYKSIWHDNQSGNVFIINQLTLPFSFNICQLKTIDDAYNAIKNMVVRGAPLIGVTGAYGLYLFIKNSKHNVTESEITNAAKYLSLARPTAVNLELVTLNMANQLINAGTKTNPTQLALQLANNAAQFEINSCSLIGDHGLPLIEKIANTKPGQTVNILTHCNAGWLACVDWGTATAPIYKAFKKGIDIHVWVDETRPRNQGARLTAFELKNMGIPYTVIADNTGGHLMQHNMVDMVIVGSDRTTLNGDVANKTGTYLKALAAFDNNIPFYVALPTTSIDFNMTDGIKNIPVEQRGADEVTTIEGIVNNQITQCLIMPPNTPVANYGFDVTPARLITALITEKGICKPTQTDIKKLQNHINKYT